MKRLKRISSIAKLDLVSTIRNKTALFFGFLFPFIFIFIFGKLGEGAAVYDIAIYDGSDKDGPVYETIVSVEAFNILTDLSDEEIKEQLEKGEIDGAIMVESSTEDGLPKYDLILSTSVVNREESGVVKSIIKGIVDQFNIQAAGVEDWMIDIVYVDVQGREYQAIDFILPGQLAFGLLNVGVMGTAYLLVSLRETLVLKRFFATPLKKADLLLGLGGSKLLYGLMQAIVIITVGYFLFDFTLVNGLYTFVQMLVFSSFGLIVFLGFGFVISALSTDSNSVAPLANIVTLPQFLLAGTFFPITFFPEWLQPISKILPLTYLNAALRRISFEGATFSDLYIEIAALLLWGVIVYAAAIRLYKWEK